MKRIILFIAAAMILAGCAWYNDLNGGSGDGLSPVSQVGGGFISSDDANDITPFMFRSQSDGNDYLFFASDRGNAVGSYDIYYSMKVGSDFTEPVKLEGVSSSEGSETSPLVLYFGVSTVIAYLSENAGVQTVEFHQLGLVNRKFTNETTLLSEPCSDKALDLAFNYTNHIYIGYENKSIIDYTYEGDYLYSNNVIIADSAFTSIDVVKVKVSLSGVYTEAEAFFYGVTTNGYEQITKAVVNVFTLIGHGTLTNAQTYDISDYSSLALQCNDRDPFVDMNDGAKVYFASDRYGLGNYDLYRFNTETFTESAFGYATEVVTPVTPVNLQPGIYVSCAYGNDSNPGTKEMPKLTISGALAALGTNTFIYLDSDFAYELPALTYFTDFENLSVIGGFNSYFTEITGNSEIIGNSIALFSINNCRNLSLANMNLYVYSVSSPAVQVYNSTNCAFDNVNVLYNDQGGGYNIQNSRGISIVNSTIQSCNNTLSGGGGLYLSSCSECVIDANVLQNLCPEFAYGGGIYMSSCMSNTIRGIIISNNCRATYGGGIYMYMSSFNTITADIGFNFCSSNSYTGYGGGLSLAYCYDNTINSHIYGNLAYYGGGIFFDNVCTNNYLFNRIENNIATNGSAGSGQGGGIYFDGYTSYDGTTFTGVIIINNLPDDTNVAS